MNGPDQFPQVKTRGMQETDLYLISDRIGRRAEKSYISINCHKGESTLRPIRPPV